MVVSIGGAAEGAERETGDHGRPGPRPESGRSGGGTRRGVMRGLFASAVTVALTPLVTATRPLRGAAAPTDDGPPDTSFDETYRGHRICGVRTTEGGTDGAGEWYVTVDGRPLHVMRRADGTWLTMVDHYRSYATPLEAARAAVDEMGPGSRLRDTGHGPGHRHDRSPGQGQGRGQDSGSGHEGGHHGLHP
ncbi:tyrosinase family oxidase copper chaperone [Streptomyces sp. NPDC005925]|uniref:tyrosinase family oxidase copper chaperone n=1 Tax=Streptomyces sp. NPDC005925 TaxID=3157172 RepID=UPI003407C2C3